MDDKIILSEIDMQASAAFKKEMAQCIYLNVKEKLRKRTDGGVTCWDISRPTLTKIHFH